MSACVEEPQPLPNTTPKVFIGTNFTKGKINENILIQAAALDRESGQLPINWVIKSTPGDDFSFVFTEEEETFFKTNTPGLYTLDAVADDGEFTASKTMRIAVSGVLNSDIESQTSLNNVFATDTLIDYYVTSSFDINDAVFISDRNIFEISANVSISVGRNGFIRALGQQNNGIEFRGEENIPGYWRGIIIDSEGENVNLFEHVRINDAGGINPDGAAIYVNGQNGSLVSIRNSEFRNSETNGIYFGEGSEIVDFGQNTFIYNLKAPIKIHSELIGSIDNTHQFENNTLDYIDVTGNIISRDITVSEAGIPYHFSTDLNVRAELNLVAGTHLQFSEMTGLFIRNSGSLFVVGTELRPVIMEGTSGFRGSWSGLHLYTEENNAITNALIRNGGGEEFRLGRSNIYIKAQDQITALSISNSKIEESLGYGIIIEVGGFLAGNNNSFVNNSEGDIFRE